MTKDRLVVYTNVIGWVYPLPEITAADQVDYICFTDQDIKKTNGWTCISVPPFLEADAFRSSREQKVRPHRWLADHSASLYIDSTVFLTTNPWNIWEKLIPNENVVFGGLFHSYRNTILEEFQAVEKAGYEHKAVLDEHRDFYESYYPETMLEKPVWGGMLARRHNEPGCIEAMETWFSHILRYSRRDQLSLPVALSKLQNEQRNVVSESIKKTDFHEWPRGGKKKPPYQKVGPPVAENLLTLTAQKERTENIPMKQSTDNSTVPEATNKIAYGFDEQSELYYAQDKAGGKKIYVSDKARLALYRRGTIRRRRQLLRDYGLSGNLVSAGDVVVDVGANIGEIGIWCEARRGIYYGFEPDPLAFSALRKNVAGNCHDVALSDTEGTADFFLKTDTADSSLFKPEKYDGIISVRKATLDAFFKESVAPEAIKLFKIEAEGMEPEVLRGAENTLNSVEYVAVDAGPERGKQNTVPEVLNFLAGKDFKILSCFLKRGTFLLRSKRFE